MRKLARKIATKKTNIMLGWNSCKYYHGDLIERMMCLVLAVSGNWGKFGTGIRSWTAGMMDGQGMIMAKTFAGVEGTEAILTARDGAIAGIQASDPSITTEELASRELGTILAQASGGAMRGLGSGALPGQSARSVEAFWWHNHAGFAERWNTREWGDDTLPRDFADYYQEALDAGWWTGVDGPSPDHPPKMLFECGGNMLRRTRGGKNVLLENLWPKLELIVSIDFRINSTGLLSDILLWGAAKYHEKADFAVYNMGGIRAALTAGEVTFGDVVDVAPFENKICLVTLSGAKVRELFAQMAMRGGEGVSHGVELQISRDGKLVSALVNGKPIDDNAQYRISTLDYVAHGNDQMTAFKSATDILAPENEQDNVRFLIVDYLREQSRQGVVVDREVEGRIKIVE